MDFGFLASSRIVVPILGNDVSLLCGRTMYSPTRKYLYFSLLLSTAEQRPPSINTNHLGLR